MSQFNNLSGAQVERLALLAEECAEVIQIVNKVLRHGYGSYSPFDEEKRTNRELLERELGDLTFAQQLMHDNEDINAIRIDILSREKRRRAVQYLHEEHKI